MSTFNLPDFPFFGSNQYHTLCATGAIQSRGGGSFQHGNAFNVVWIDIADTVTIIPLSSKNAGCSQGLVVDRYSVNNI